MYKRIIAFPLIRTLISAVAGLCAYGAWAYLANIGHGESLAWRAAVTQGSYSFVITLLLTSLIEYLFSRLQDTSRRRRFLLSTLPICALLYVSSWLVNYFAGTPNILLTILPGLIMSTVFIMSYVGSLLRMEV